MGSSIISRYLTYNQCSSTTEYSQCFFDIICSNEISATWGSRLMLCCGGISIAIKRSVYRVIRIGVKHCRRNQYSSYPDLVIFCGFDRRSMTMLGANIGITKHYRLCLTRCWIGSSPAQHSVSQWELKCNGLLPPCQRDTRIHSIPSIGLLIASGGIEPLVDD